MRNSMILQKHATIQRLERKEKLTPWELDTLNRARRVMRKFVGEKPVVVGRTLWTASGDSVTHQPAKVIP